MGNVPVSGGQNQLKQKCQRGVLTMYTNHLNWLDPDPGFILLPILIYSDEVLVMNTDSTPCTSLISQWRW